MTDMEIILYINQHMPSRIREEVFGETNINIIAQKLPETIKECIYEYAKNRTQKNIAFGEIVTERQPGCDIPKYGMFLEYHPVHKDKAYIIWENEIRPSLMKYKKLERTKRRILIHSLNPNTQERPITSIETVETPKSIKSILDEICAK